MSTPPSHSDAWRSLEPWHKAAEWTIAAPDIAVIVARIAEEELRRDHEAKEQTRRHLQRLAWAELVADVIGLLLGFGAVVVLSVVANAFVAAGATVQGAAIFGAGTAATATVFVTANRFRRKRDARGQ